MFGISAANLLMQEYKNKAAYHYRYPYGSTSGERNTWINNTFTHYTTMVTSFAGPSHAHAVKLSGLFSDLAKACRN